MAASLDVYMNLAEQDFSQVRLDEFQYYGIKIDPKNHFSGLQILGIEQGGVLIDCGIPISGTDCIHRFSNENFQHLIMCCGQSIEDNGKMPGIFSVVKFNNKPWLLRVDSRQYREIESRSRKTRVTLRPYSKYQIGVKSKAWFNESLIQNFSTSFDRRCLDSSELKNLREEIKQDLILGKRNLIYLGLSRKKLISCKFAPIYGVFHYAYNGIPPRNPVMAVFLDVKSNEYIALQRDEVTITAKLPGKYKLSTLEIGNYHLVKEFASRDIADTTQEIIDDMKSGYVNSRLTYNFDIITFATYNGKLIKKELLEEIFLESSSLLTKNTLKKDSKDGLMKIVYSDYDVFCNCFSNNYKSDPMLRKQLGLDDD